MAYLPDYDLRPRVKHLPGSAGLKASEILEAPPAVQLRGQTETFMGIHIGDNPLPQISEAARRIAASETARKRREAVRKIRIQSADPQTRDWVRAVIEAEDATKRAAVVVSKLDKPKTGKPDLSVELDGEELTGEQTAPKENPGRVWEFGSAAAEVRDNIRISGEVLPGEIADRIFGLPPVELQHLPGEISLEGALEQRRSRHVSMGDSMTSLQEQAITRADQA